VTQGYDYFIKIQSNENMKQSLFFIVLLAVAAGCAQKNL